MIPSESKYIATAKEWYEGDFDIDMHWRERAKQSFGFYTGVQQWDPAVVAFLAQSGRPALTINRILSTVHVPCGYQRRNRSDIKLFPRKGGTRPVAELGTSLIGHTMDVSAGYYEASDMFLDGVVSGKGWLSLDIDKSNDPAHGDLVVQRESTFEMMGDQTNQHADLNKGARVWRSKWRDKREIQLKYNKSAKVLDEAMSNPYWYSEQDHRYSHEDPYGQDWPMFDETPSQDEDGILKLTMYLVKECWYTRWETVHFLRHAPTLKLQRLKSEDAKRAAQVLLADPEARGEFSIVDAPAKVLYKAVTVGDMVLEHVEDPMNGVAVFPFFRFIPYLVDGYIFGMVDNLIGPQMELNKRRSVSLHHANQTANSGWIVGSSGDDEAMGKLEQFGSMPNVVLDASKYGDRLEKIQPNKLDTANFTLGEQAAVDIEKISGINDDLTGGRDKNESGKARMVRQEAGLTVSEVIFDHFDRTQEALGVCMWEMIRTSDIYSPEEIESVVTENSLRHFMVPDPMTGEPTVDMSPMQNWTTGRYGVSVKRGANSPTVRMAMAEQLLEMMTAGVPIPPRELIEASDLPNKEAIMQAMDEAAQAQQGEPQGVAG